MGDLGRHVPAERVGAEQELAAGGLQRRASEAERIAGVQRRREYDEQQ
jgi:hypothetical protein